MDNHCVMCGSYLADTGRMVCEKCEKPKTELKPCPLIEELKFTREFIHEHGLDFALASAWNRRVNNGN